MKLKISDELSLPPDAVTETFAFLAKRGAGKTYAASVLAEEMLGAGAQVVVLDCLDVWWGLRSSPDGKGAGLPIAIFGGEHGDIPLEATAGAYIADLLVSERLSAVLVVEQFSKADQRRFATDFAERLFSRNREAMHLILEEADRWAPQRPIKGEERMLGAFEEIVRRGRSKGIGATLVTQRSAVLHKDVLTQTEVLVAMRTPAKHDRRAIEDWFDAHEAEHVAEVMQTVPSLGTGEAWVSSPYWLGVLKRVRFRRRHTFDSSSTPKLGEARRLARTFADIDLAVIKEQMAETIERAKADDPKALRRRITELERQVADSPPPMVVERKVIPGELIAVVNRARRALHDAADMLVATSAEVAEVEERAYRDNKAEHDRTDLPRARQGSGGTRPVERPGPAQRPDPPQRRQSRGEALPGAATLDRSQRSILTVLATHGPRTHDQLALQTGYSAKASTIGVALSKLRRAGYVAAGQPVAVTPEGIEALGQYEELPTGPALLDYWREKVGGGAERRVLDVLVERWPEELSLGEMAELTGYSPAASTIGVAMSKLRKLRLARGWTADDEFMAAIT